jgi:enterochelin esterase-like enzyme
MFSYLLFSWLTFSFTTDPQVSAGTLEIHHDFSSKFVSDRHIYVWLPDAYEQGGSFPVLYMHDGQMLWDSTTSWNKQEWGIDETMQKLIDQKIIPATIVVGIANVDGERHGDYFPEKPFRSLDKVIQDSLLAVGRGSYPLFKDNVNSDQYLKFIVHELKPFIDQTYATSPSVHSTMIAGSSMGGLISMYAFFEYPDVFGGAACLSTHWIGGFVQNETIPTAFAQYISSRLPLLQGRKLYFDLGTETLDANYPVHQQKIDDLLNMADTEKKNWMSRQFEGDAHDEKSWNARFHIPLKFLLKF